MPETIPKDLLSERLPDWYRAVSISLDGGHLETRQQIIEALAESLEVDSAESAVAYAYGRKARGENLIELIRETAREYDGAFAAEAKDAEPQVMIGAAVAHHLVTKSRTDLSAVLSLFALSAEFRGFKPAINGQKLGQVAALQLRSAGEARRSSPTSSPSLLSTAVSKKFDALEQIPEDGNPALNTQVAPWVTAAQASVEAIAKRVDSLEKSLRASHRTTTEQLEQTAWLLEESCALAQTAWVDLQPDAVPLLAATELSEISLYPGQPAAEVLLASTIYKAGGDPSANLDVLKGVQRAAKFLDGVPAGEGGELLPLVAAVVACREMNGRSGWRDLAKTRRGGSKLPSANALRISSQFLRELFLMQLLSDD